MPWVESSPDFPPPGAVRAATEDGGVVLTDAGLFRYEFDAHLALRRLLRAGEVAAKLDVAAGVVRWAGTRYQLYGDADVTPRVAPDPGEPDEDEPGFRTAAGAVELLDPAGAVALRVPFPPRGARWGFTCPGARGRVLLVSPAGTRTFRWDAPPAPPKPPAAPGYRAAPEFQSLLRAVGANQDDDLPRLVLADWLEEQGAGDWAALIRLQCAQALGHLGEGPPPPPAGAYDSGGMNEAALRSRAGADTLGLRKPPRGVWSHSNDCWRGLPVVNATSAAAFVRYARGLNDPAPAESLRLEGWLDLAAGQALAGSPFAARLRLLACATSGGEHAGELLAALAGGPHLRGLRWLTLAHHGSPPAEIVRRLNQQGAWPHLARLTLTGIPWWGEGDPPLLEAAAAALVEAEHFPALRVVELPRESCFSDAARRRLAARFARVEYEGG